MVKNSVKKKETEADGMLKKDAGAISRRKGTWTGEE